MKLWTFKEHLPRSDLHNLGPSHVPPCVAGNASEVLGFSADANVTSEGFEPRSGWWYTYHPSEKYESVTLWLCQNSY